MQSPELSVSFTCHLNPAIGMNENRSIQESDKPAINEPVDLMYFRLISSLYEKFYPRDINYILYACGKIFRMPRSLRLPGVFAYLESSLT